MKTIIFIFIFTVINIKASIITGNQEKISIIGGSMNVTSYGVTKQINSGQIVFIQKGKAPSNVIELDQMHLININEELKNESSFEQQISKIDSK